MQGNTDEEDRILLHSFHPSKVDRILEVKHNVATDLELRSIINLDEQAWNCLGCILGTSTSVTKLFISLCDLNVTCLCAGLQYNQNIMDFRFYGIDLEDAEKMKSLAPFLSNNPSLEDITIFDCNIGQGGINILANALMNRTADTLKRLDLFGNNLGDCNLDRLITSLSTCTKLRSLSLSSNGIGRRVCVSLAQLLKSRGSSLKYLNLCGNHIDDEGIEILSVSLFNNTNLRELFLASRNSRITGSGWRSLLKLICNTLSLTTVKKSNHTLNCLGICGDTIRNSVISALGVDDANLLFASLELNNEWSWRANRLSLITRQKILWGHAKGDINIADSDIPDGAMPVILSWFGDDSNEKTAHLIKYHDPPLPEEVVMTKRLDSLYRIIRDKPDLCQSGQHSVDDVSELTDTLAHTSLGQWYSVRDA